MKKILLLTSYAALSICANSNVAAVNATVSGDAAYNKSNGVNKIILYNDTKDVITIRMYPNFHKFIYDSSAPEGKWEWSISGGYTESVDSKGQGTMGPLNDPRVHDKPYFGGTENSEGEAYTSVIPYAEISSPAWSSSILFKFRDDKGDQYSETFGVTAEDGSLAEVRVAVQYIKTPQDAKYIMHVTEKTFIPTNKKRSEINFQD